jgi:acetyl esterase/lipase
MAGDLAIDVPVYNQVFAGLAKQWPPLEERLDVCKYIVRAVRHTALLLDLVCATIMSIEMSDSSLVPGLIADETVSLPPHTVQVRIYKPKSEHPLPLMLYFPGGGYIAGNL